MRRMSSPPRPVRRIFLPWNRPWLTQATEWLAGDWDGGGPLDLSDVLAIVPTRQAGRRLREALAGFAATRGRAVFAPRVLTPESLLQQDVAHNVASPLEALLAWAEVLRGLELDQFREVFPVDPPERTFAWSLRLAQQFARLQLTLGEAGLRLSDVTERAGPDFVEAERWERIGELGRRQETQLARYDLREPQDERIAVAARCELETRFRRIVVLAVPDLPPLAVHRLANAAHQTPIDVVLFADPADADAFDAWGRPLPQRWEHRDVELAAFEERVHLCADPGAQAVRIADLATQYQARESVLAVGVADPEVVTALEAELHRADVPVFNPDGSSMRYEGLHALLAVMADLIHDPSFGVVERLARCPDFLEFLQSRKGPGFSAAQWLRALDQLHAKHLPPDLRTAREFAGSGEEEPAFGLAAMESLRQLARGKSFGRGVSALMVELFSGRDIDRTIEADVRLETAVVAWTELVRQCLEAEKHFPDLSVSDWWELALRLFAEQRTVEEKPAGAIELQGWLELLWEDAPHLVVAGLNEGRVPEAVADDAFLPGSLRRSLGLITDAERLARDAYLLQALSTSRKEKGRLDVLFGKTASSGDPLRPSRLLLRCADMVLPERIAFLFRLADSDDSYAPWTRAWKLKPRSAPPPQRVAVTALRRYLACPFRFYLRNVLRMEGVDALKNELDAFDFGTLCHASLEQIWKNPALRDCTDSRTLANELLHHLDRTVQERYGRLLSLPLLVQIESARQRLSKLAELQASDRGAGWEILHVERPFEIEVAGLLVRGKIDRIDRHVDTGAVRVLDYKTSDTPVTPADAHVRAIRSGEIIPEWARIGMSIRPRAWADLQLPLYRRALTAEFGPDITCGYFNLPKAAGSTAISLWEDYTIELHESAMRCAEGACAAIVRGEFWPPNELIDAERDDFASLFHHGAAESVERSAE